MVVSAIQVELVLEPGEERTADSWIRNIVVQLARLRKVEGPTGPARAVQSNDSRIRRGCEDSHSVLQVELCPIMATFLVLERVV